MTIEESEKASSQPSFISCISTSKHLNSFISSVRQDALSMTCVELAGVAHTLKQSKGRQTVWSQAHSYNILLVYTS